MHNTCASQGLTLGDRRAVIKRGEEKACDIRCVTVRTFCFNWLITIQSPWELSVITKIISTVGILTSDSEDVLKKILKYEIPSFKEKLYSLTHIYTILP